ncbi:MAG TPA: ABC transporter ATP-binding protein [Candidatus Limnocylindrales bacterium]|nr:ABC transporter ATP-binding protein [Candidatus Limnocylindrales bacterium]
MTVALLTVEGLVKDYGAVHAVRGLDLEVAQGEVLGFLGPNGAGKTTTIRCLLGLLRPTAGRISVFGLDVAEAGVPIRARLAYVPGELRLPDRMTTRQLAATIGRMRGGIEPARRERLAERLGLDLDRPLGDLSTGNRRKVALLLAFASNAELLVLDEPTNGLDPLMQRVFLDLVREAVGEGASVLLSSHVLSEVQRAADRVVVLRGGEVIAQGSVDELRRSARQRLEIWFEGQVPEAIARVPGLGDASIDGDRLTATLVGPIQPLLAALGSSRVTSMLVEEPDLEDAFVDLYRTPA